MRSETSTGWFVRSASLTLATMMFLTSRIDGGEIKVVSPSPWAETEADGTAYDVSDARLQHVLPASDFAELPAGNRVLISMATRSDGGETALDDPIHATFSDLLLRFTTTANEVGELNSTYEENWGAAPTTVLEGDIVVSTSNTPHGVAPKDFDIVFEFQTPYEYDPSVGNLLIDWSWGDQSPGIVYDFVVDTNQIFTQWIWSRPRDTQVAEFSTGGLIWEFTFVPEPSTLLLAALGVILVFSYMRPRDLRA